MSIGTSGPDGRPEPAATGATAGPQPGPTGPGAEHRQPPAAAPDPSGPAPSGLFPSGPPRPTYREPHPVRTGPVLAGIGGGTGWLTVFGLLGADLPARAWWLLAAGGLAWLAALALARSGDRGVAVGLAAATGVGWAVVAWLVVRQWVVTSDWPLW